MAKIHFEVGPFGAGACGKMNVDTSKSPTEVTCKRCRGTDVFSKSRTEARHKMRRVKK